MVHGSTEDRAGKIREAAMKLAFECKREGDSATESTLMELRELSDSSLATLYNILNGLDKK